MEEKGAKEDKTRQLLLSVEVETDWRLVETDVSFASLLSVSLTLLLLVGCNNTDKSDCWREGGRGGCVLP